MMANFVPALVAMTTVVTLLYFSSTSQAANYQYQCEFASQCGGANNWICIYTATKYCKCVQNVAGVMFCTYNEGITPDTPAPQCTDTARQCGGLYNYSYVNSARGGWNCGCAQNYYGPACCANCPASTATTTTAVTTTGSTTTTASTTTTTTPTTATTATTATATTTPETTMTTTTPTTATTISTTTGSTSTTPTTDYCAVCSQHTMCIYSGRDSSKCYGTQGPAIDSTQQQQILDKHNQLRQKVAQGQETQGKPGPQPGASNMQTMKWNSELATIAQRWASQCTPPHDKCRNTTTYSWVGQNYYGSGSTSSGDAPQFDAAVQAWYDEVKDFDPANIKPYHFVAGPPDTGHYTQVAWAISTDVGCGYDKYYDGTYYWTSVVCNYGPGGNVEGASMYEKV